MRVLVVDDEPDVLLLCRVNLAFAGHEVLEAIDVPQAIDVARAEKPDLLVLDMMLPGGDGLSVLDALQSEPDTRDTPVIMLTAKARGEDERAGFEAGATLYMTKPFSPAALCEAVESVGSMSADQRRAVRESNLRHLAILRSE